MYKSVKRGMLKEVFHAEAKRLGVRSGYNLFTSRNMRAFGAGEYVDYSLLVLSVGGLQLLAGGGSRRGKGGAGLGG